MTGGFRVPEGHDKQTIDTVLRTLVTASRSLRLYPAASPMRRQSVDAVHSGLQAVFAGGSDALQLAIARDGFASDGEPVAVGVPGGPELAAELRVHGVSAVSFAQSTSVDDLLALLMLLAQPAEEVRAAGGFGAALAADGVTGITVTEIQLTVLEGATAAEPGTGMGTGFGGSTAEELAEDPAKLGAWLAEAASGDRSSLQSGLVSLVTAVGPAGTGDLAASMSTAFAGQTTDTRDTLLGLAMEAGPFRNLMGEMFRHQEANEIAGSILDGAFGRNMLSLSTALTALPLDKLDDAVRAQVQSMLPSTGHSDTEARFLAHMIAVRKANAAEPSLAASDQTYLAVAQASAIRPDDLERACRAVAASGTAIDAAGVRTLFTLLEQQTDLAQIRISAANLVSMVTRLLIAHQLPLADYVLFELNDRSDRIPVAELFPQAATPEALGGLLDATLADASQEELAHRIMTSFGESAYPTLVAESVSRKTEGLALAERMIGKRIIEPLNTAVLQAQWFQLAPVVTRLALEGDSRSGATIEALMRRPDPAARKEIVNGLTAAGGPLAQRLLGELVSDSHAEVAVAAARSLAKSGLSGSGDPIAARLAQLDYDNADFELARDLIAALARTPDRSADELLGKIGSRRALIKRGHFNDVQAAVAAALQMRSSQAVGK
jgi:hypothetical protein